MIKLTIPIILLLAAVGAFASPHVPYPPEQSPNGLSVYFDLEGETYCVVVEDWTPGPEAGFTVMAYLLLTYPETDFPSVQAWEANVYVTTNSYLYPTVSLTPGAIDIDPDPYDYVVDCGGAAAIPITGDFTMLASIELPWLGFEGTAECTAHVGGVNGSESFPDGAGYIPEPGFPIPCTSAYYSWGDCAWIDHECFVIGTEGMAWGDIKSLY